MYFKIKEVELIGNEFLISEVDLKDQEKMKNIHDFLQKEQLIINDNVDHCAVIYDSSKIIATISKYCNTIRYLAVKSDYQGFNLTNKLVSYIINIIYEEGFNEVFVFTKPIYLKHFQALGFNLLYDNDNFIFLTNRWDLFQQYLNYLKEHKQLNKKNASCIILNANPFTKGHKHLIKMASQNSDIVYLILVKEDISLFTYQQRKEMVKNGIKDLKNIVFLDGSSYLISKSTFPSYFLPSKQEAMIQQTILDANIFAKYIAPILEIKTRFVGEEPFSKTTKQYNETLKEELKSYQIKLELIARLKNKKIIISATTVRKLFITGDFKQLALLVPESTLVFLKKLNYLDYQTKINITGLVEKKH